MADSFEIATGHVTIDTKFDGRKVRRISYREGHGAGTSFYRGFHRGSLYRFNKLWKTFFKPLSNLKKWLTRLRMPAIFAGLLGSALTLIPTLTQLGSVVGVGMIPAFLAWFSTIGMVRGILGDLSKSIKSQTLKALDSASQKFKDLASEAAKPGLNAFLQEAIRHIPILNKYVSELGHHISDVGFAMRDMLRRGQNIERIKLTLNDTAKATGIWYSLLDEAAEVLIALASSGAPLFLRFTRSMEAVGHTIHDWIMLQKATGALDRYLNNAYLTLEKFGRGGRDFLIGLFNIINGGVFGTEKVADSFERWGASFRKWSSDADNVAKVRDTIKWFADHVDEFFRFAAAATAVQLALSQIGKIKGIALFVRTLLGLGPLGFILFGIGAALSSLMGGFVLAYTHSEKFRKKLYELFGMIKTRVGPILADWWKWMKEELAPVLEDLAVKGIGRLKDAISGLLDTVDDNKEALKEWQPVIIFLVKALSYLTGFAIKGLIEELGGLIQMLGWVGRGIGLLRRLFANLPGWFGAVIDAVTGWWRALKDTVGDAIHAVTGYFQMLQDRAGRTVDHTAQAFRELPGKIVRFLKSLPGALAKSLEAALEGGIYVVARGLGMIVEFFVRLPGRVISQMDALWEGMKRAVSRGIVATVSFFATLPARISTWWTKTWKSVLDLTTSWLVRIVSFISELPSRIGKWIEKTWKTAQDTTKRWFKIILAFIGGLPNWAAGALVALGPKIVRRFTDAWTGGQKTSNNLVAKIITFIGGIAVRAWKALVALKNRLVDRFAEGWSAATGTSKTKVASIINFILGIPGRAFNALRALAGLLVQRIRTAWNSFQQNLGSKVASTIVFVSQIPGRINRGLGKLGGLLVQKGKDVIQGLWSGMTAIWDKVMGWIKSIPGWIKAHKGPLSFDRNLLVPAGRAIMEGLHIGLLGGASGPLGFLSGIAGNIAGMLKLDPMAMFGDVLTSGPGGGPAGLRGFAAAAWGLLKRFGLSMGGYRAHGSVPGSDHPKGKAIDIMTGSWIMHKILRAFVQHLPGAKYWISMRQIAMAREGWRPRPYSGPSPHTDHVHASFFRQGTNRLPEDILGFGKSGRGYVMHRGEQVLRRNETTNNSNTVTHYHFAPNSVVLDASTIHDLGDVVRLIKGLQATARANGVPGVRVT